MNKISLFLIFFSPLALAQTQLKTIVSNINWNEVKLPFVSTPQTQNKYYKVTFFDDFKGKPDNSAESNYCYDTLKPQCSIWSGYDGLTFPCDLSHLSLTDPGPTPPMKTNFKSALYSLNPSANYEALTLSNVKSAYTNVLNARWKDINKCNWTSYLTVNWMATDYADHYTAKMDPTQVTIDPRGKGYLILSARKGKVAEQCIFGGTVGPSVGLLGKSCLLNNLQSFLTGPLSIYWIDPDIKWPGIYYHKISGGCPYGGSGTVNCQVHSFAPGELSPLISYKIMNYNSIARLYYLDIQKFACGMNVEYPNNGVVFNKLSCPILNGGILSQKAIDATNHKNGFVQRNGVFEVKLKIPRGKDAFPAAWLMPIKGGWPYSGGEIDVMEARGDGNGDTKGIFQTFHQGKCIDSVTKTEIIYDPNNPSVLIDNGSCQKIQNAVSINYFKGITTQEKEAKQFNTRDHVYSVEWSDSKIQWYLNNKPTNMIAPGVTPEGTHFNNAMQGLVQTGDIPTNLFVFDSHNLPHDPFYWILNHSTWVASADMASWTEQHHYIDYVKVYNECKTNNDFCPKGGAFVEGTGCVLTTSGSRSSTTTYPSVCVSNFKSRVCPAGGEVAGPNCQVHTFQKPKVIPGVNYWIDPSPTYPGAYYAKVNGSCPFGGSAGVNCQFETLSPVFNTPQNKTVIPGIQYWVDTDARWPGIYYKKINGACSAGGSGSVNCQLKGYAPNFLRPGVAYWLDTNPLWPGVYYKKIFNACPYGGSGSVNCQVDGLSVPSFYLNPTVSYWLDTNINFPGIYYAKIGGTCPYGGIAGVNCQIKAYPKPTTPYVVPNVNYWVDANPDFPGIYYAKINGACPFGGSAGVNCQLLTFPSGQVEPGVKYWIDKNPSYPGVYYGPDFR